MGADKKQSLVALRSRREQVIAILSDNFANDVLDIDQFDDRVGSAHRAESVAELDELVGDLEPASEEPAEESEALAPTPGADEALVPASSADGALTVTRPDSKKVVAVFGGVDRKGDWLVPKKLRAVAVMGGVSLDFREVRLPPGVTEVHATAVMGGVDIYVPPTLAVQCEGMAIFGGFDEVDRAPVSPDPDAPLLLIKGVAVMGGVDIQTRLPGESGFGAWRRRRREQKALRAKHAARLEAEQQKQLDAPATKQLPGGDD